jgi:hypothetical protein
MHQSTEVVAISPIALHHLGDKGKGEMSELSQTLTLDYSMNLPDREVESTHCRILSNPVGPSAATGGFVVCHGTVALPLIPLISDATPSKRHLPMKKRHNNDRFAVPTRFSELKLELDPSESRRQRPATASGNILHCEPDTSKSPRLEPQTMSMSSRSHSRAINRTNIDSEQVLLEAQRTRAEQMYRLSTWHMYCRIVAHRRKFPLPTDHSNTSMALACTEMSLKDHQQMMTTKRLASSTINFLPRGSSFLETNQDEDMPFEIEI